MEKKKSKVEDVELFLKLLDLSNSSCPLDNKIKTFLDIILFCCKLNTSKRTAEEQIKQEAFLRTHRELFLSLVLNLEIDKRILGWKALFTIIKYVHSSNVSQKNRNLHFLQECKNFLEHLIFENIDGDNDKDHNITLFCLNLLEYYKNVWSGNFPLQHESTEKIFDDIFKICQRIAFTHSSATLTSFKCLAVILEIAKNCSVCKKSICCEVFNGNDVLEILMANWENAVPAVRKLAKELFKEWLHRNEDCEEQFKVSPIKCGIKNCGLNCKVRLFDAIMNSVSWKHSFEYHMLVVLLESLDSIPKVIYDINGLYAMKIQAGLTLSLKNHDLATAGAELYRALLNMLPELEWESMFECYIRDHLNSDNRMVIANIFKYWMPATFNKYTLYSPLFFNCNITNPSLNYLSTIKMLKMKRKRGGYQPNQSDRFLERCLECSDEDVRCDALGLVCEASSDIEPWEYKLVKEFLFENINYDRSNLRQSMVNYCITFFLRIRGSVISRVNSENNIDDAMNFVDDLYKFLIANFNKHSNFQRKMASLMLYNAVLTYFGIGGSQEKDQRKSNTKDKSGIVEEQATKLGKWNFRSKTSRKLLISCIDDISDSVRVIAADILVHHFKFDKDDQTELNELYNSGKEMCSSHFFHKVESGALLIKTITILAFKTDYCLIENMLINSNPNLFSKSKIPMITLDLIDLANCQSSVLFKDIFMAAVHGSPLHGVLRSLMLLLTDETEFNFTAILKNISAKDVQGIFNNANSTGTFFSFSISVANQLAKNKPDEDCDLVESLITLLEKNVSTMIALLSFGQNDSSKYIAFSPSFAEMGESLEEIVRQSEVSYSHDEVLMLPVSHQLVLNCIWFNLKISCLFASGLITSGVVRYKEGSCYRCFTILETVLNKCRHKGAMDVAGSSMLLATKAVMEKGDQFSDEDRNVPAKILDNFFKNISSDANSSLSRRSAGRSFLVHSIVASDPRPNNPLLGKTLCKLIEIIGENVQNDDKTLVDLPQVSALHILSTLVQDSKLNILPYAKEIFCVCFDKFSSPIYTVKNAALQLFKSLLMRLMRRMKGECQNDIEFDNHQTTPVEELFFHMPHLFSFVEKKLDLLSSNTDINSHAKLIPILVFLSNLSITFYKDYNDNYSVFTKNIRKFVQRLLSSPVYFVRKLSARINTNFLLPNEMSADVTATTIRVEQACLNDCLDQNLVHGLVLNLKYLSIRLITLGKEIHSHFLTLAKSNPQEHIFQCLIMLIKLPDTSYFMKSQVVDVIRLWQPSVTFKTYRPGNLTTVKTNVVQYKTHVGSSLWLARIVENLCAKDNSSDLKRFCLLENNIPDVSLAYLKVCELISPSYNIDKDGLVQAMINIRHEPEIIEQMLKNMFDCFVYDDVELLNFIFAVVVKNSKFGFKCKCLGMLVACRVLSYRSEEEFHSKYADITLEIVECLSEWSSPSTVNEEMRSTVADCVQYFRNILLKKMNSNSLVEKVVFDRRADKLGSYMWLTLFNLLQDENLEIRMKACKFFPSVYSHTDLDVPNPFVALRKLIQVQYMMQMMNLKTALDQLWSVFSPLDESNDNVNKSIDLLNPFDHGIKNFYKDDTWLHGIINNEFKRLSEESTFCRQYLKRRYYELKAVAEVKVKSAEYQKCVENNRLSLLEDIVK